MGHLSILSKQSLRVGGTPFCQTITYRTTGAKPADVIQKLRNSVDPRIATTVDS